MTPSFIPVVCLDCGEKVSRKSLTDPGIVCTSCCSVHRSNLAQEVIRVKQLSQKLSINWIIRMQSEVQCDLPTFKLSNSKLRAHHVIVNAVGLLFILFAMFLVFGDSPAVPMILVTGMVFLFLGCFPWAYKLPSYVALAVGGTLIAAACLAGLYVPLIIGRGFVDGETPGFLIHLINFTLGVPGIVLILAGVARFFRWLLFKTSTQLENADGSKSLLKPKHRWFQFSLQKFLVVVTLFAYGLGWLVIWFDEPEARRVGYSTSVVNGRIYVLGGMAPLGSGGQIQSKVSSNAWLAAPSESKTNTHRDDSRPSEKKEFCASRKPPAMLVERHPPGFGKVAQPACWNTSKLSISLNARASLLVKVCSRIPSASKVTIDTRS